MSLLIVAILCLFSFLGGKVFSVLSHGITVSFPFKAETVVFVVSSFPVLKVVLVVVGSVLVLDVAFILVLHHYLKSPNLIDDLVADFSDEATLVSSESFLKIRVDKPEALAPAETVPPPPVAPTPDPQQIQDLSLVIHRESPTRPDTGAGRERPGEQQQQQAIQERRCPSHLNTLRQVAVSALLRNGGGTVFVEAEEEVCFASIVEVVDDEHLKDVQPEDPPAVTTSSTTPEVHQTVEPTPERPRPSCLTFLRQVAVSAMLRKMNESQECFAKIEEVVEEEEELAAPRPELVIQPGVPAHAEPAEPVDNVLPHDDDLDFPSYEDFVLGAPAEPLFEKKHFAFEGLPVRKPPPIPVVASQFDAKASPARPSRIALLSRLAARHAASAAA
ncbi:hypothetical protein C8J57DRAFT_1226617 [Mycena rebaudengoi]|nr:hypothetical protein C8J57DRAFT_1226617 [Mycena rebaudengoi]